MYKIDSKSHTTLLQNFPALSFYQRKTC